MANLKDQGMTALEAVDYFCTYWTWAGTFSDDPKEREQAFRAAASELGAMLRHKIPDQPRCTTKQATPQGDRVRRRAKKALEGIKEPSPEERKKAVFKAMMTARQNPDQSLVPLWATGYKVGADQNAYPELIATDMWFFKRRGRIKVDIEANAAAGDGLKYVGLRIYDTTPAQAVPGDAQDAVAIVDAMKACGDQLQRAAELSEPADPKSSAVRPNRRGRIKGTGSYDSTDMPLIEKMHGLIKSGKARNPWSASLVFVDDAEGIDKTINKQKRLVRKYIVRYPRSENHSL